MRRILAALALGLTVAVSVLSISAPVLAAPAPSTVSALQFPAGEISTPDAAATPSLSTEPSPSGTPSDPANAGTGEPAEEEATRIDLAPYVIGGVALVTALAVFIVRRRRRGKATG
jgi:hypothetical protein